MTCLGNWCLWKWVARGFDVQYGPWISSLELWCVVANLEILLQRLIIRHYRHHTYKRRLTWHQATPALDLHKTSTNIITNQISHWSIARTTPLTPLIERLQFQGHIIPKLRCAQFSYSALHPIRLCRAINYRLFQGSSCRLPQWSRWKAVLLVPQAKGNLSGQSEAKQTFCSNESSMWREEKKTENRHVAVNFKRYSMGSIDICGVAALGFLVVEATWTWRAECRKGCGSARSSYEMWYPEVKKDQAPFKIAALFAPYRVI